jgi:hypothetical protein
VRREARRADKNNESRDSRNEAKRVKIFTALNKEIDRHGNETVTVNFKNKD